MQGAKKTIFYPVGREGQKWNEEEFKEWAAAQGNVKRSYKEEVLDKISLLKDDFDVEQYGALSVDKERYPLMSVKTRNWDQNKPNILVTGGVHGYETSGVQGALLFVKTEMLKYSEKFNVLVCPCLNPWGYECIQRWDCTGIDPNRSFYDNSPCEPSAAVFNLIKKLGLKWMQHTDLHETTNSDYTEFMPALASRNGMQFENLGSVPINVKLEDAPGGTKALEMFNKVDKDQTGQVSHAQFVSCLMEEGVDLKQCLPEFDAEKHPTIKKDEFMRTIVEKLLFKFQKCDDTNGKFDNDAIPDGFYLVGDSTNPQKEWSKAIIDKVRTVTHITPPDSNGTILGEPITQDGEFCCDIHAEKLCASVTKAQYNTTTEVYPDSTVPGVTGQQCNDAQVAVVVAALDYLIANELNQG